MSSQKCKLGDLIRQVNIRNIDLSVQNVLGISNEKYFIKTKANLVDTKLNNYKVLRKGQFAYNIATERNGDKISIALLEEDSCVISPTYVAFELVNKEKLLPEYLMLWFKRPTFDRYARFHADGSIRANFPYEKIANVELNIPTIKEQQRILNHFNILEERITLKEKINNNLVL